MTEPLAFPKTPDSQVFLLGKAGDRHLEALAKACEGAGLRTHLLNSRQLPSGPALSIDLDLKEVRIEGQLVKAIFARHLPSLAPALTRPERFSRAQCTKAIREGAEIRDAWLAALSLLEQAQVPVLNPPFHFSLDQHKVRQLLWAKEAGLEIPRTQVVSGFAPSISPKSQELIQKGLRGGSVRSPAQREGAFFLQTKLSGLPSRVTMLDGRVLTSAFLEGTTTLDYRECPRFISGELRWKVIKCPQHVSEALCALSKRLRLRFHASDFVISDTTWRFLEMNPSPAWLDVERDLNVPITKEIANALLKGV